jgi:hypothetical protein
MGGCGGELIMPDSLGKVKTPPLSRFVRPGGQKMANGVYSEIVSRTPWGFGQLL